MRRFACLLYHYSNVRELNEAHYRNSRFQMHLTNCKTHPYHYISAGRTKHTTPTNILWITCDLKIAMKVQLTNQALTYQITSIDTIYSTATVVNSCSAPN